MGGTGSNMRGWMFAVVAALALFLSGLVLSYVLWVRIAPGTPPPCSQDREEIIFAATERLHGAAALLGSASPEIRITPRHVFHFAFDYACIVPTGESAEGLRRRLGFDWPCAGTWASQVETDETFISMFAVAGAQGPSPRVTPLRLRKADFDIAVDMGERLAPDAVLVLRKRPGSEQVLLRAEE